MKWPGHNSSGLHVTGLSCILCHWGWAGRVGQSLSVLYGEGGNRVGAQVSGGFGQDGGGSEPGQVVQGCRGAPMLHTLQQRPGGHVPSRSVCRVENL